MKIYAIRDRLIDYFMQPFAAPGDKEVMAAVARNINSGEISDISQAPHHFEIWQLGVLTEDGHLVPERGLVADCASLVRPGIRTARDANRPETASEPRSGNGTDRGGLRITPAELAALQAAHARQDGPAEEVLQGTAGGYPPRDKLDG